MRTAWVTVGLLWAVAVLNYLDRQLVVTMPGPIKADLGISDARFGLFPSVFLWVYGLCSPLAGYLADRVGRKPVIVASLALWSAATLGTGFVTSFEQMIVARVLLGVSEAFYMPAAVALIVDYHAGSTRSRATGLHLSGVYVGMVLGGFGGWFAEEAGWRFAFQLFGAVGIAYALFLVVVLRVPDVHEEGAERGPRGPLPSPSPLAGEGSREGGALSAGEGAPPSRSTPHPVRSRAHEPPSPVRGEGKTQSPPTNPFLALLAVRGFVLLLVMNALNGAAYWPVRNWLPSFFSSEIGVGQKWAGVYGVMTFSAAAFAGMLLGSSISDYYSRRTQRVRALVPAVGFCLAAPCLFLVGMASYVPLLLAAIVVVGMSQGFLDANLMPAVCTVADPRHRATGYGLMNLVGTTAGGVMTFVGGYMKDNQIPFAVLFQVGAGFILAAGLLLFFVKPK